MKFLSLSKAHTIILLLSRCRETLCSSYHADNTHKTSSTWMKHTYIGGDPRGLELWFRKVIPRPCGRSVGANNVVPFQDERTATWYWNPVLNKMPGHTNKHTNIHTCIHTYTYTYISIAILDRSLASETVVRKPMWSVQWSDGCSCLLARCAMQELALQLGVRSGGSIETARFEAFAMECRVYILATANIYINIHLTCPMIYDHLSKWVVGKSGRPWTHSISPLLSSLPFLFLPIFSPSLFPPSSNG
jgi:hypothetical protein